MVTDFVADHQFDRHLHKLLTKKEKMIQATMNVPTSMNPER
jgi:hypothetical protein